MCVHLGVIAPLEKFRTLTGESSNEFNTLRGELKNTDLFLKPSVYVVEGAGVCVLNVQLLTIGGVTPSAHSGATSINCFSTTCLPAVLSSRIAARISV